LYAMNINPTSEAALPSPFFVEVCYINTGSAEALAQAEQLTHIVRNTSIFLVIINLKLIFLVKKLRPNWLKHFNSI